MAKKPTKTTAVTRYEGYAELEGAGFTDQHGEDLLIPFIDVLQPLSPQLETIKGAKPGMLFNTVTEELYTDLTFVPATRDWNFVEWIPREKGGGFVAVHAPASDIVREARANAESFGKYRHKGNELQETFYLYVILADFSMAVLPFRSTKIRPYKTLMTRLRTLQVVSGDRRVNPPLMAYRLKLSTVKQKNEKGTWFNFKIDPDADTLLDCLIEPANPLFTQANELRLMVEKGRATAAYESTTNAEADEDVPF